jgi:hypothetical protein
MLIKYFILNIFKFKGLITFFPHLINEKEKIKK